MAGYRVDAQCAQWLRRVHLFDRRRAAAMRIAIGLALLVTGCGSREAEERRDGLVGRPLVRTAPNFTEGRFTKLAPETTGIDFVNLLKPANNFSYLNIGAGVATGDYDGDGRVDVYLASIDGRNRLYRQTAPFQFADVTERAGVDGGEAWSRGTTFVDVDADGDLDLYVCNTEAPNVLYVNHGDGTFHDAASEFGLDHVGASCMASFADYDRDGDLDLYLVTHRTLHFMMPITLVDEIDAPSGTRRSPQQMRPPMPARRADGSLGAADPEHWFRAGPRYEIAGEPDILFRNEGNGKFVNVTESAGVFDRGLGLSATWLDLDADGWLDLHVANDLLTPDRMYRNNRDGTFLEVTSDALPHMPWFSMGADCADIDNDGRVDLLVADMSATTHYRAKVVMGDMSAYRWSMTNSWPRQLMRNALYLNSGVGRFLEVAHMAGVASSDWTWAVQLSDLDNDGWVDAFFSNGAPRDDMNPDHIDAAKEEASRLGAAAYDSALRRVPSAPDANLAFRNTRDLSFEDVSERWGLNHTGVSFGVSVADLDRDGDLDLVVNNMNEVASIYRNDGVTRHAVLLRLHGAGDNTHGVGAVASVETVESNQRRTLMLARGFMSSNDPILHFGLGESETINALQIDWPSGRSQRFENLPANHLYDITEPSDGPTTSAASRPNPQFEEVASALGVTGAHIERDYDDFASQPLLPAKLSQLGPGVGVGDIDADGDADFFVAGAAGQAGAMYVNGGTAGFTRVPGAWMADAPREDMAPLLFDADADGDLDLFVTSGSVEYPPGDSALHDRLYLNNGDGEFTPALDRIESRRPESASCVTAADFDRDGDLDLFVGGRVVPGRYPVAPRSFLLRNEHGFFKDVTDDWATGLRTAGMVTSALWSDVDRDGYVDLLVTYEWGPVRLFRNDGSRLLERTAEAGLADRKGWWNAITGGDLDHDGDIDYVVANCGLNTKYGAPTFEDPAILFYGDMEGNGRTHLVEAKSVPNGLLPVRGRSCSSGSMPFIAEKFPTYHNFASAMLGEIYDPAKLRSALTLRATTLASGILLNDGTGRFEWRPLPRPAQISPAFGVVVSDVDADGSTDIYAVQNSFAREPETGVWAGGLSTLLSGDGSGVFSPVGARESGLVVPGDAKGLALLDFDQDGWPDLVVTQNNGGTLLFRNRGVADRRSVAVGLRGPAGNPTGVGARVTLESATAVTQAAEIYAGSGYLSQSSPQVYFGVPASSSSCTFTVAWPDGRESRHVEELGAGGTVRLIHPGDVD